MMTMRRNLKCRKPKKGLHRHGRVVKMDGLHFAAPGLSVRAECMPLAANHGDGHAACLHARPGLAHPAPSIRDHMKNPG